MSAKVSSLIRLTQPKANKKMGVADSAAATARPRPERATGTASSRLRGSAPSSRGAEATLASTTSPATAAPGRSAKLSPRRPCSTSIST